MGWEYRAVEWTSHDPDYDEVFLGRRTKLIAEGWQEHIRAHWRPSLTGGACIMRRPKDEPRKGWTERRELQKRNEELQGRLSECQETTEALIQKIAVMSQPGPRADGGWLGPPKQADLIGCLERRNEELAGRCSKHVEHICALTDRIVRLDAAIEKAKTILGRLAFSEMPKEESNGCLCG